MKTTMFFICCFISQLVYSQETEKYNYFADQLKSISTKPFSIKFKNGKLKRTGFVTIYVIDSVKYEVYTGKFVKYNKNGNKSYELILDKTGTTLSSKFYISGDLYSESKTLELDTNATTVNEFFFGRHVSVIYEEKLFLIDKKNNLVLWKKGVILNSKKSGEWITYKEGKPFKTKKHKERNKFKNMPRIKYLRLNLKD